MTYEELLMQADRSGLIVKEKSLSGSDGRIYGRRIAIKKNLKTSAEKSCTLAEEIGHYQTSVGDIVDLQNDSDIKQEYRARLMGYNTLIGLRGLVEAFEHGCQSQSETAEYLQVTERFLTDAINCYKSKYGIYTTVDNYIIYFEPSLMVGKLTD